MYSSRPQLRGPLNLEIESMTKQDSRNILAGAIRYALDRGVPVRIRGEWYGIKIRYGRHVVTLPDSWGVTAAELYGLVLA